MSKSEIIHVPDTQVKGARLMVYQIDLWDFYFASTVNALLISETMTAGDTGQCRLLDRAEKIADQMVERSKAKKRPAETPIGGIK